VQNPLTSLHEASEAARWAIAAQRGPTVLVGHSFSGMIVTDVGVDPKITALVYVPARASDAGEDYCFAHSITLSARIKPISILLCRPVSLCHGYP